MNWGGFVNHSFTITAGPAKYHLKLSDERDAIEGLRRWHELHGGRPTGGYHDETKVTWRP